MAAEKSRREKEAATRKGASTLLEAAATASSPPSDKDKPRKTKSATKEKPASATKEKPASATKENPASATKVKPAKEKTSKKHHAEPVVNGDDQAIIGADEPEKVESKRGKRSPPPSPSLCPSLFLSEI